jgi:quercetin dioxygenase-like cupin family protein
MTSLTSEPRADGKTDVAGQQKGSVNMATTYTHILDLAKEVQPPDKGILSRTLFNDDRLKAVIFGFGQGEELSEHTASMSAILHFLQGEATVTLGDDVQEAQAGTWVHMPTGQRHSIQAKTPVVMLLLLLKEAKP